MLWNPAVSGRWSCCAPPLLRDRWTPGERALPSPHHTFGSSLTGTTYRFHPQVSPTGIAPKGVTHSITSSITRSITHRHHSHISPTGISCSPTIITRSFAVQCLDSVSFSSFPLKCVDSGSTPLPNTVWASTFFICNMRLCERLLHVTVSVWGSVLFSPLP